MVAMCFGRLGPFQTMIVCAEIKQKEPQDRITIFETLSLPVAKDPVACRETGANEGRDFLLAAPFRYPLRSGSIIDAGKRIEVRNLANMRELTIWW